MKLPISPGNFVNIEQGDIPLRGVYVVKYHVKLKKRSVLGPIQSPLQQWGEIWQEA